MLEIVKVNIQGALRVAFKDHLEFLVRHLKLDERLGSLRCSVFTY